MKDIPVVTVDGPSGTGKGTLSSYLAETLEWHLLDSGALYRLLALAVQKHGFGLEEEKKVGDLARELDAQFSHDPTGMTHFTLNGEDVSEMIRSEECGNAASKIAALPEIRGALLDRQRAFQQAPGLVADGRDMGTVVFPFAGLKIYLTASADERARRRYKQLKAKGISVNLARLSADIAERDTRDQERAASPLKPAADAILINTTDLDISSVNQEVLALVHERFSG